MWRIFRILKTCISFAYSYWVFLLLLFFCIYFPFSKKKKYSIHPKKFNIHLNSAITKFSNFSTKHSYFFLFVPWYNPT